jgi:PhoH-like ATPase
VTKDINLRMKGKSIGLRAEDYETGKVRISTTSTPEEHDRGRSGEIIDRLSKMSGFRSAETGSGATPLPHEYFILRSGTKSSLSVFNPDDSTLRLVEKKRCYGITPRNAEQSFALDALTNPAVKLVTLAGKSGTGKTLMALAAALEKRKDFKQILLARPIIRCRTGTSVFLRATSRANSTPTCSAVIRQSVGDKESVRGGLSRLPAHRGNGRGREASHHALAYIRGEAFRKCISLLTRRRISRRTR